MGETSRFYVVKEKAVPEVLLKVVEAKRLLSTDKELSVKEATDKVEISRSSFYKYKDDIFPFDDNAKGRIITVGIEVQDRSGLLAEILQIIAMYYANILTIHQSIPIGGMANISISVEVTENTGNISKMVEDIEGILEVHSIKILARE